MVIMMKNELGREIGYDLEEWSMLITELCDKEVDLFKCKNEYQILSDKIIQDTDFKALYGANNQKVRDNHVKGELKDCMMRLKVWSLVLITLIVGLCF